MRKILYHFQGSKNTIASRLKRVGTLISRNKLIGYGSIAAATLMALPFGVYAFGNITSQNGTGGGNSSETMTINNPTVKGNSEIETPDQKNASSDTNNGSQSASSSGSNSNGGTNDVNVTVNGQKVPVPENGTIHKRITDDNKTQVDVTIDNRSNQNNTSSSSTSVEVSQHSYSNSSVNEDNQEGSAPRRQPRTPF